MESSRVVLAVAAFLCMSLCDAGRVAYSLRKGSDCMGRDLKIMKADLATCQSECDKTCECRSIQHHGDECYIKSHACNKKELKANALGNDYVKKGYCERRKKDCLEHDIGPMLKTDSESCKAACDKDCKCLSIQHHGKDCWLKNYVCKDSELLDVDYAVDYIKIGDAGCPA